MGEVSKIVGISFVGFEREAMNLFVAIEKKWQEKMEESRAGLSKQKKVSRELSNLECMVVYDRRRGSGRQRREGGAFATNLS